MNKCYFGLGLPVRVSTVNITGCCLHWCMMSKYGNLLLAQAKTELRKRKARLSGPPVSTLVHVLVIRAHVMVFVRRITFCCNCGVQTLA